MILNRAFYDQSPSPAVYTNQVALLASQGLDTFALKFGDPFVGLSEDQLSTKLLGNLGVLPNADLQIALRDYLVSVGKANVGIVALQLGQLLSGLEHAAVDQAVFKAAAVAWNRELEDSHAYSSNPANAVLNPPALIDEPGTGVSLLLTSGEDAISPAAAEARFKSTVLNDTIYATTAGLLSTTDTIDGGEGVDTLVATLATGATVAPVLRNVEKALITAGVGAEFSAAGTSGLTELWINATDGPATFCGLGLGTVVGIQNSTVSGALTVGFSGASGSMDEATIVLADAIGSGEIAMAGIEILTVKSTAGKVAATMINNARITAAQAEKITILGDQALTTTVTGARLSVVDASAFTQALDLKLVGTGGVAITANAQARHKIALGAGPDTLAITGLAGAVAKDIDLGTATTLAASAIEVRDFASGTDLIRLTGAASTTKAAPGGAELASIATASSLLDATALAATTAGANKAIAFRVGADTYILVNDSVAALGANDSLIKLTGVAALADGSWTSA